MDERLGLAELVCARICHDLSGVLAGLIGSVELLTGTDTDPDAAILAMESVAVLGRRLKLIRAAWGAHPEPLEVARLVDLAAGLARRRMSLDTATMDPDLIFAPRFGQVLASLLLLASESLPAGGALRLTGRRDDVIARLEGDGGAWPVGFAALTLDAAAAWDEVKTARALAGPMTALLAHTHGVRLTLLMVGGTAEAAPPLRLSVA
jgi:histidine phosphotransferase ChpT